MALYRSENDLAITQQIRPRELQRPTMLRYGRQDHVPIAAKLRRRVPESFAVVLHRGDPLCTKKSPVPFELGRCELAGHPVLLHRSVDDLAVGTELLRRELQSEAAAHDREQDDLPVAAELL